MALYTAESSEIVRSTLRDEEHLSELETTLSALVHSMIGHRRMFISSQWISTLARAIYYSATTVAGVQTIGEEYLGLVQVQASDPRYIASDSQRLFSSIVEASHSLIITKLFTMLADYGQILRNQNHLHPVLYKLSQELPYLSTSFVSFIKTFNIALFYIFSTPYYEVSKAAANIQYRSLRPQANLQSRQLYTIIGIASLVRLLMVAKRKYERLAEEATDIDREAEALQTDTEQKFKFECPLCFDNTPPVSTPCGHAFCWNCIERTRESSDTGGVLQCPNCRFQFENNRAIPLMNM